MCKGGKTCPPSIHVPVTPAEKGVDRSHSHCLCSLYLSDERGAMIASTTKGPAACVWMRLSFLLSFLLLLYLCLLTTSDLSHFLFPPLPHHLFPLPSPSLPAQSFAACCHSLVLLLHSSLGPLRYNQGTELKIRKCPCRRDTPDGTLWCLINLKFICCHTSFYSLPPSLSLFLLLLSPFLRLPPPYLLQVPSCTIQLERNEEKGEERKMHCTSVSESHFLYFIFHVFTLWRRRDDIMNHLIFFLIVGTRVRGLRGRSQGVRDHRTERKCGGKSLWCHFRTGC